MTPSSVLVLLIILGAIWTAGWALVLVRSRRAVDDPRLEHKENRLRVTFFAILAVASIVIFILTLHWLPYQATRITEMGPPKVMVNVTGMQWSWVVSPNKVPAGVPVEFTLRTVDVNHDFAIYNARGRLLAQVQDMPGYRNKLVYRFNEPGTYTIRCLEYCGIGHHVMIAPIVVTAAAAAVASAR